MDDHFSALAGTERLCLGKAAAQVDGPEGHSAQRGENSSWSARANTHRKAFTGTRVPALSSLNTEPREYKWEVLFPHSPLGQPNPIAVQLTVTTSPVQPGDHGDIEGRE